jgi:hypothetical protein
MSVLRQLRCTQCTKDFSEQVGGRPPKRCPACRCGAGRSYKCSVCSTMHQYEGRGRTPKVCKSCRSQGGIKTCALCEAQYRGKACPTCQEDRLRMLGERAAVLYSLLSESVSRKHCIRCGRRCDVNTNQRGTILIHKVTAANGVAQAYAPTRSVDSVASMVEQTDAICLACYVESLPAGDGHEESLRLWPRAFSARRPVLHAGMVELTMRRVQKQVCESGDEM